MKKNLIIGVITILILQSMVITIKADPGPDFDLMIIVPEEFEEEILPLKQFKDATGRPSVIVTLEDIYSGYTGDDKAEKIKKCIADYESVHNVQYVMLVGDVDKLPIRYFLVQTMNDSGEKVDWFAYYMTDHYYADLYDSGGAFCSWNADGDDYYAETVRYWPSFDFVNVDDVDYEFDVIVSRLPASTDAHVTNYVNRVIEYETEVYDTDAWFNKIMLVTGNGHSIYPEEPEPGDPDPYYDIVQLDSLGDRLAAEGYSEVKLYHDLDHGDYLPTVDNINDQLNLGAGFFTILSHQNRQSYGVYGFPDDMDDLANDDKYPVMFSLGCSPAQIGPIGPNQNYLDTDGVVQNYGYAYPIAYDDWVTPNPPNVMQTTTDLLAIPEDLLVNHDDKGAIAFIGSMAEASSKIGYPASNYYHQSIADGEMVLAENWRDVADQVLSSHPPEDSWENSRRWLFLNIFGDPTLNIGGLPDKPPVTTISFTPAYETGGINYVNSDSIFTLSPTDDFGVDTTKYRYYLEGDTPPSWSIGTTFSIGSPDGDYIIEYYSTDTGGNTEYPIKSLYVTYDNTATTTTIDIGTPKHTSGSDTYITSDTNIELTAVDALSGVDYTKYQINGGGWITYSGEFEITGADGTYTIDYYSVDNIGNIESTKSKELILDNTAPDIDLIWGTPQYNDGTLDWVTSSTEFIISAFDSGAGVDPASVKYTLNYKFNSDTYTYSGPFTLPHDNNNNAVEFVIDIEAKDYLNNKKTDSDTIWVDDKPPTAMLNMGDPYYFVYGETEYIYITSDTDYWFEPHDWEDYGGGVGVDYTTYRIDGIDPWILYTLGDTFSFYGDDGLHHIEYYSVDLLGNTAETWLSEYFLDNTPPETTLNVGAPSHYWAGDTFVSSLTDLALTAEDTGAGVDYSKYRIEGGAWIDYVGAFQLTGPDGPYLIEFYSVDNLGNTETIKSETLILDNTPPEVKIEIPEDGDYVYGYIEIEITATDEGSGVHDVEYSLDGGVTWLPAGYSFGKDRWIGSWDTTAFSEGAHTPLARATDNVDNVGYDETPPTVNVLYLEYEVDFSDSNWNAIEDFNVVFNEQKPGIYKINTNPGSMYEIITITNTGTLVTLPELILDVMIPIETDFLGFGKEAFICHGSKYVHIYLNGEDVTPTGKWQPDLGNLDVMQALAPGDTIEVYVHYDYSFKGESYTDPDVSSWPGEDYVFVSDILSAYGPNWNNTLSANPVIIYK
jgi:hypothetical protein